jgi:hypothetical protein
MRFSKDGQFLFGFISHRQGGPEDEPVCLNIAPYLDQGQLAIANRKEPLPQLEILDTVVGRKDVSARKTMTPNVKESALQVSGAIEFTTFQGQLQMSALTQDFKSGSIVLQTLRANGETQEERLARFPKSSTLEKSYSTLVPSGSHENLRLVLDKALQETYSIKEVPDFQLPSVWDRERSSIPIMTYRPQKSIESGAGQKRVIEESVDDTADGRQALKRTMGAKRKL